MIYCVEDDDSIRELMLYTLRSTGFESQGFSCAAELWDNMSERLPKLIILDIMLPGEDGISVLKKLRSSPATAEIPVMMATAKGSEYDKVTGLDMGADDYMVKPFGMMEMVSRIKAILRRSEPAEKKSVISAGGIVLDKAKHKVSAGEKSIMLTLKEYELLSLFMENPDRVFTREQLMRHVWKEDSIVESRTVDVHIGTLRTKLGDSGSMIKTVRGVGYKLEAAHEE